MQIYKSKFKESGIGKSKYMIGINLKPESQTNGDEVHTHCCQHQRQKNKDQHHGTKLVIEHVT